MKHAWILILLLCVTGLVGCSITMPADVAKIDEFNGNAQSFLALIANDPLERPVVRQWAKDDAVQWQLMADWAHAKHPLVPASQPAK